MPLAPSPASPSPSKSQTPKPELALSLEGESVRIDLPWEGGSVVRSYAPQNGLTRPKLSKKEIPVEGTQAVDLAVPHNVVLYYRAVGPRGTILHARLPVPNKALPPLANPRLEVDKANYTLAVIDGSKTQKRYPIALGRNHVNRKYCQDMASTPEGAYTIYNLQPNATYHKALDVDYPRQVDRVRHSLAIEFDIIEAERPIGGEIQIHGWGIRYDWTAGCMALRDEDMDELFANPGIAAGIPVFIAGFQLRPEDRPWILEPQKRQILAAPSMGRRKRLQR